jgi:hypothetical protein
MTIYLELEARELIWRKRGLRRDEDPMSQDLKMIPFNRLNKKL